MADYDCSYCFIGLHDRCTGKSPSGDGPCDCHVCSSKTLTAEQTCEASGKTLEEINTAISNVQDITRRLTGKD